MPEEAPVTSAVDMLAGSGRDTPASQRPDAPALIRLARRA